VGHHALREQAAERLGDVDLADPLERAGPEAGVEQVQDRVLDPPIYWSTGSQRSATAWSNGRSAGWLAKRTKYQEESTKCRACRSRAARLRRIWGSRRASRSDGARAGCRGLSKVMSSGSFTGSWSLRHRHRDRKASQWMIGIGVPQ
jgi:hypothetical protein